LSGVEGTVTLSSAAALSVAAAAGGSEVLVSTAAVTVEEDSSVEESGTDFEFATSFDSVQPISREAMPIRTAYPAVPETTEH
jgi:hypothetical protein